MPRFCDDGGRGTVRTGDGAGVVTPNGAGSVHRAHRFVISEQQDQPLDLAPVAEMDEIAEVAAALGARGGLQPGLVAEIGDQRPGIVERLPVGNE